ncbi:MerR family transcriptional regulator [Bacillus cereus group sp. MYBK245-2]|nr:MULTISPECIES: MerR family transcriptional regulator [Bacillus cereus group]MDW3035972.1 MerR family transcriptional regulator [Bacillus pacificus]TNP07880.1 MerR family transcriptional regulator [Bacillus pacificus]UTG86135.1 MerR family transcriptional regulator [Bacillus pacificus]
MDKMYTIQQIAELTNLSTHTLRYYEKIGLLKNIKRNESGYRVYCEVDLAWIEFLIRLRETGMSIQEMIEFSNLRVMGDITATERRILLENHKENVLDHMEQLQKHLRKIEEKIIYYTNLEKE